MLLSIQIVSGLFAFIILLLLFIFIIKFIKNKYIRLFFKIWLDLAFLNIILSFSHLTIPVQNSGLIYMVYIIVYFVLFYIFSKKSIGDLIYLYENYKKNKLLDKKERNKLQKTKKLENKGFIKNILVFIAFIFLNMILFNGYHLNNGSFTDSNNGYLINSDGEILMDNNGDGIYYMGFFDRIGNDGMVDEIAYDLNGDNKIDLRYVTIDGEKIEEIIDYSGQKIWIIILSIVFLSGLFYRNKKIKLSGGSVVVSIVLLGLFFSNIVVFNDKVYARDGEDSLVELAEDQAFEDYLISEDEGEYLDDDNTGNNYWDDPEYRKELEKQEIPSLCTDPETKDSAQCWAYNGNSEDKDENNIENNNIENNDNWDDLMLSKIKDGSSIFNNFYDELGNKNLNDIKKIADGLKKGSKNKALIDNVNKLTKNLKKTQFLNSSLGILGKTLSLGSNFLDKEKKFDGDTQKAIVGTVASDVLGGIVSANPIDLIVGLGSTSLSIVGYKNNIGDFTAGSIVNNVVDHAFTTTPGEAFEIIKDQYESIGKAKGFIDTGSAILKGTITSVYTAGVMGSKIYLEGATKALKGVSNIAVSGVNKLANGISSLFSW